MKVLIIDNYDSFTYNLVHYVQGFLLNEDTLSVVRNDELLVNDIKFYDKIILSPGPGLPNEKQNLLPAVEQAVQLQKHLLGVCLGHQAIALYFGAKLKNLSQPYHGVASGMNIINPSPLYNGIENNLKVGRYHSWVVENSSLPNNLVVDGLDDENRIMSFHHITLPVFGVQYHPESILTENGKKIIQNFLNI